MLILSLETSTEFGSCALFDDGRMLERDCPLGRSHSETLLPLVRELMLEAGVTFSQLDAIAFGAGPGAFTGLRVACGVAQGLAVVSDLPLIPVTSLETMAVTAGSTHVLALLDARMGEVYAATYRVDGEVAALQGEIRVSSPGEVLLPEGDGWMACGNALTAYPVLLERIVAVNRVFRPEILPTAAMVARIAAHRFGRGAGIDPAMAAPLYIRDKVAKTVAERLGEGGKA
ncbi:MAG: tRNA (adenosine(37)-N6)-threonylcarbamoyltransferase complex dimerization subunit type 1 TsaB [Rhodocyclaceae bacterium]|nr:tRNA (adenosine(37)-N6)-threonylcarbamoyltransferase complex dimerization subunit type 1 TsaB [Rhodocyclaceae bacterium]